MAFLGQNVILYKFQFRFCNYNSIFILSDMLLSGTNKSNTNSTLATSRSATKPLTKKKNNFIVYSFKQLWSLLVGFWTRFRKFMWVGSTGFIIMVVPFVFAYMQEMQNQMIRMMEMQNGNRMM